MRNDVQHFADSALVRAVVRNRDDGELPSKRSAPDPRREYHGPTYQMVTHLQQQTGDPLKPHGVPPGYEHPQRLGPDVLDPGGPRILPVGQEIQHGPQQSRAAEFDAATQEAVDLATWHATVGFYDRRFEGRRYRSGHLYEDRREPPPRGGWQRDVPFHRYETY